MLIIRFDAARRSIGVAACMLLLATVARAQAPQNAIAPASTPPQTYSLQYKYAAGQLRNYKSTVDVTGTVNTGFGNQTLSEQFDELFNQEIQSVKSDGEATIATHIIAAQGMLDGQAKPYSDEQIQEMQPKAPEVIGPTGRIIDDGSNAPGSTGDANSYLKIGQVQVLPNDPIGLNGSWRSTVSAMGLTLYTRSTLDRVTTQTDGDIARISTKYYGMSGQAGSHLQAGSSKTYLLVTGSGITQFNITTGTVQDVAITLDTHATVNAPPATSKNAGVQGPVKVHLTAKMHMELLGNDETP